MTKCCVVNCGATNTNNQQKLTFHRFPKDECLKRQWLETVGEENTLNIKFGVHFQDNCFNKTLTVVRLRDESIPSIFSVSKKRKLETVFLETKRIENLDVLTSFGPFPYLLEDKPQQKNEAIQKVNMDKRQQELRKIQEYIEVVDKETTLLLQSLQWDSKHLLESPAMVTCKFVSDHKTPLRSQEAHEKRCYLAHLGYSQQEVLLPDVIDPNAETVVKLNHQDIMNIINTAAASDPAFKRGVGSVGTEPLSLSRLQLAYSADERRAIHDAVVAAAPPDQELTDLDLPSSSSSGRRTTAKSAAEMLAELRDMKRRRARYRVAANTTRYSDVLRDVIKTQMELYAEAKGIFIKTEYGPKSYVSLQDKSTENDVTDIVIKQERISPDRDNNKERSRRYKERSRSRDRRRRMEHKDRETSSRKRHHFNEEDNSSHNRRRDNSNQGRYSKERNNDESHSKRYKYNKNLSEHKYDDRYQRAESRSQKYYERSEDRRKSKYNDSSYDSSKTSKYDKSSKEYDKHSNHRDNSSNGSKSDYKRKHDEYEKHTHFNVYREHKHREYDRIKKEKVDYDDD